MHVIKIALRVMLTVLAVPLFAVATYLVLVCIAVIQKGYDWQVMDWNGDGTTSVAEFFESSDVGRRTVTEDGKVCMEYFAYKDGLPVKRICN